MVAQKKLILASASPRRKALLRQLGLQFEVKESGVIEDVLDGVGPEEYVTMLSKKKAASVASAETDAIVIGADTIVVIDGNILNKPSDVEDAVAMLTKLSGRTHRVYTGFTLFDKPSNTYVSAVEATDVTFRKLDAGEIRDYVQSGSPMDKAGSYGIQDDFGAVFVQRISGCFYNVVGFPLARFYTTLREFQQQLRLT
ncbi:MAG TPA: Maf family protein [Bacteroidota bacterium]|jgi:septum formation protein|nr:Maf family protein [Bacteroidota bacterium]